MLEQSCKMPYVICFQTVRIKDDRNGMVDLHQLQTELKVNISFIALLDCVKRVYRPHTDKAFQGLTCPLSQPKTALIN